MNERVREWGLREDVVEKDYVIGWLLWGTGSNPAFSTSWVFKGGTCLKKCYLETYRFSEDLDFTVLPGGLIKPDEVLPVLQDVFKRIYDQIGIDFRERARLSVSVPMVTHPKAEYIIGGQETLLNWPAFRHSMQPRVYFAVRNLALTYLNKYASIFVNVA
jgi:hypothetical protein